MSTDTPASVLPPCPYNCFVGPDGGRWTKDGPCPRQRVHDKEDGYV